MTMLGLPVGRPCCLAARTPAPFERQPGEMDRLRRPDGGAADGRPVCSGALNSRASMLTQRLWISVVWGYSSASTKLRPNDSVINMSASGSIQVVTKLARLSAGLPSRFSSSWMIW